MESLGRQHGSSYYPPGVGNTADVHTSHFVPPAGASEEHIGGFQLSLRVLELGSLAQVELPSALHGAGARARHRRAAAHPHAGSSGVLRGARLQLWNEGVRGLGGQEGELGGDAAGTGWAAEEAAELAQRQAVHPSMWEAGMTTRSLYCTAVAHTNPEAEQRCAYSQCNAKCLN